MSNEFSAPCVEVNLHPNYISNMHRNTRPPPYRAPGMRHKPVELVNTLDDAMLLLTRRRVPADMIWDKLVRPAWSARDCDRPPQVAMHTSMSMTYPLDVSELLVINPYEALAHTERITAFRSEMIQRIATERQAGRETPTFPDNYYLQLAPLRTCAERAIKVHRRFTDAGMIAKVYITYTGLQSTDKTEMNSQAQGILNVAPFATSRMTLVTMPGYWQPFTICTPIQARNTEEATAIQMALGNSPCRVPVQGRDFEKRVELHPIGSASAVTYLLDIEELLRFMIHTAPGATGRDDILQAVEDEWGFCERERLEEWHSAGVAEVLHRYAVAFRKLTDCPVYERYEIARETLSAADKVVLRLNCLWDFYKSVVESLPAGRLHGGSFVVCYPSHDWTHNSDLLETVRSRSKPSSTATTRCPSANSNRSSPTITSFSGEIDFSRMRGDSSSSSSSRF